MEININYYQKYIIIIVSINLLILFFFSLLWSKSFYLKLSDQDFIALEQGVQKIYNEELSCKQFKEYDYSISRVNQQTRFCLSSPYYPSFTDFQYLVLPPQRKNKIGTDADIRSKFTELIPIRRIYVRSDSSNLADGNSWDTAFNSIQKAIEATEIAPDYRGIVEIWVAQGIYMGSITLKNGVRLYGGFKGI